MISTDRKSDLVESLYFSTLVIYPRVDMSGAEFTEYRRQILRANPQNNHRLYIKSNGVPP
jgi:hypothetical protein